MNRDKVEGLLNELAKRFERDALEGISWLNEQFRDDPMTSKALLILISMRYPQYSEAISSYLQVYFYIREEKRDTDEVPFNLIKQLVFSQLSTASLLFHHGNDVEARKAIQRSIIDLTDFLHRWDISSQSEAEDNTNLTDDIRTVIKASEKHLDRLCDFVIVANQDKILKEMVAFKITLDTLDERIRKFIATRF